MHGIIAHSIIVQVFVFLPFLALSESQSISPIAFECYDDTCSCCKVDCKYTYLYRYGTRYKSWYCDGGCKDGYHGPKCWERCPFNCITCIDAVGLNITANCTRCKDGYYSTQTQYQCQLSCSSIGCKLCHSSTFCTSCLDGYYLTDSNQCEPCNDTCLTCNSKSSCSSCKAGYYLEETKGICYKCGPLCYTCASNTSCTCHNGCSGNLCQKNSSVCLFGCKQNFFFGRMGTCVSCLDGRFGYLCNETCSANCSSVCDRISGFCAACRSGLYGDYCDRPCPQHCASTCNNTNGYCNACKHGYYGNQCNLECSTQCQDCRQMDGGCTACVDGSYGEVCDQNCSQHCVVNKCKQTDGSCDCKAGFTGQRCQHMISTTTGVSTSKKTLRVVTPTPENIVLPAVGATLGGVALIAAVLSLLIWIYKHRGRCCKANHPKVRLKESTKHEAKIKAELASIEAEVTSIQKRENAVIAKRMKLESELRHLDQHMPYGHTERADVIQPYSSYEQLSDRKSVSEDNPYVTIDDVGVKEERVSYEVLQMAREDCKYYSSLKTAVRD